MIDKGQAQRGGILSEGTYPYFERTPAFSRDIHTTFEIAMKVRRLEEISRENAVCGNENLKNAPTSKRMSPFFVLKG